MPSLQDPPSIPSMRRMDRAQPVVLHSLLPAVAALGSLPAVALPTQVVAMPFCPTCHTCRATRTAVQAEAQLHWTATGSGAMMEGPHTISSTTTRTGPGGSRPGAGQSVVHQATSGRIAT